MIKLLFSICWILLSLTNTFNQTSAGDFLQIAIEKTDEGDYEESINYCSKAILLNENYELAYYQRAYNYYMLNEYKRAITDFSETLRINPENVHAVIMRAECHGELGNRMKALKDYNRARKIDFFFTMSHISSNLLNSIVSSGS